ncbi:MAG: SHOCT domain-containing protein, partial [Myxococcales bacterium]
PAANDPIALLSDLGRLHEAGTLTDEEFAAQKARILAQM